MVSNFFSVETVPRQFEAIMFLLIRKVHVVGTREDSKHLGFFSNFLSKIIDTQEALT